MNSKTSISISIFLLLLVIFSGLINAPYFYQDTSLAYYGFSITALAFVITPPNFI